MAKIDRYALRKTDQFAVKKTFIMINNHFCHMIFY